MSKKINVVLFDRASGEWSEHEIARGNIKEYTKLLKCDYFDIVQVCENLDVYIDDEGLMVDEPKMNMVATMMGLRPLAGSLVFTGGCDKNGNTLSLTEWSIEQLKGLVTPINV